MKSILYFIACILSLTLNAQLPIYFNTLDECKLSPGWNFTTLNGNYGFNVNKDQVSVFPDGSCLISYEQKNRSDITRRRFQLRSQSFAIGGYDRYYLVFNMQYLRPFNSTFNLYMNYGTTNILVRSFSTEVRDLTTQSVSVSIPISATSVYFYFDYDFNGNDGGTKIILDDFIFSPDNGDCTRALPITKSDICLIGHISGSLSFSPSQNICAGDYSGSSWYRFISDFTGLARVNCSAKYNNSLTIFEGSCNNLLPVICTNKDEIGFKGEFIEFQVKSGINYFIRSSRKINDFGLETGSHCISIEQIPTTTTPPPSHDLCDQRTKVQVNGPCVQGFNRHALTGSKLPSLNQRSRADVWYEFTAISSKPHEIIPHANFADVITIFEGNCSNLMEVVAADLGHKLTFNPVSGKNYIVQITGYFASIEGDLCLSVVEQQDNSTPNEICQTATPLVLNSSCVSSIFTTNQLSVKKPSCVVYHAPDVWFSFVAPQERQVAIRISAGFLYHFAVYSGTCTNLTERICGLTPDPCSGYITMDNLTAGQTYFLQIMSAINILPATNGQLCVRIDELSKTTPFEPVQLNLTLDCLHGVLGQVSYTIEGGISPIEYNGPDQSELYLPGEIIEAFAEDANGCRSFAKLESNCIPPIKCNNSNLTTDIQVECLVDQIGRQTGEVILHVSGKGGSGVYYLYGTQDGARLKHGDDYKVIVIDQDSCFVIEEGRIYCPPFDCAQSALKVDVQYDCVDTLLKAILRVEVSGQLGQIVLNGNNSGDLLDQGENFKTTVIDEAGCEREINGIIQCDFDSCAYSRLKLEVDYICISSAPGQNTGRAVLVVNGSSKAGSVIYIGNQPGDTLMDKESYHVTLQDPFGCRLEAEGVINCTVSSYDDYHTDLLQVHPNPTNGIVEVILPGAEKIRKNEWSISVTDLSGKLWLSQYLKGNDKSKQLILDLSNLPSGLYSIRAASDGIFQWTKILKL
ncbi:MAG: T9SS type A sorting domain-containing protein [Saprospiraceae bacterium]|nr:T9SS type A sorting domain-containing protein [Saprospiraceae bacterium]